MIKYIVEYVVLLLGPHFQFDWDPVFGNSYIYNWNEDCLPMGSSGGHWKNKGSNL